MLFNSYEFIFLFLPIVTFVSYQIGGQNRACVVVWLIAASLFFYGFWNPDYLYLLLLSLLLNHTISYLLSVHSLNLKNEKLLLALGITFNLMLLGYFKYASFCVSIVNNLLETSLEMNSTVLPLGISFFTFQQIAYLIDIVSGKVREHKFLDYCLFITFFPQLIAGPIVHHREIIPQLANPSAFRFEPGNIALGITIFSVGLFKKVILADGIAVYSTPLFDRALQGNDLAFFETWSGLLAYSLQLYFDFSGYSDMAVGASRMLGIKLPINFTSPYKAKNIIDFWRRWHMTLSHFLRDYLYIPLGGNRRGEIRRNINLMITMLLSGLWHGAGWNFILWGGLHGLYLITNYQWRSFCRWLGYGFIKSGWWVERLSCLVTYLAFVASLALFRADNLSAAKAILVGMTGANGFSVPDSFDAVASRVILLLLIIWLAPNVQELFLENADVQKTSNAKDGDRYRLWWKWQPSYLWAIATSSLIIVSILNMSEVTEFLYFDF